MNRVIIRRGRDPRKLLSRLGWVRDGRGFYQPRTGERMSRYVAHLYIAHLSESELHTRK